MIKECNFKHKFIKGDRKGKYMCELSISSLTSCYKYMTGFIHKEKKENCCDMILPKICDGEDNCILFQIYKKLHPEKYTKLPKEPPIKTIDSFLNTDDYGESNAYSKKLFRRKR